MPDGSEQERITDSSFEEVAFHTELPQETVAELAQSISTEVK